MCWLWLLFFAGLTVFLILARGSAPETTLKSAIPQVVTPSFFDDKAEGSADGPWHPVRQGHVRTLDVGHHITRPWRRFPRAVYASKELLHRLGQRGLDPSHQFMSCCSRVFSRSCSPNLTFRRIGIQCRTCSVSSAERCVKRCVSSTPPDAEGLLNLPLRQGAIEAAFSGTDLITGHGTSSTQASRHATVPGPCVRTPERYWGSRAGQGLGSSHAATLRAECRSAVGDGPLNTACGKTSNVRPAPALTKLIWARARRLMRVLVPIRSPSAPRCTWRPVCAGRAAIGLQTVPCGLYGKAT
jgi:hypothetical protein